LGLQGLLEYLEDKITKEADTGKEFDAFAGEVIDAFHADALGQVRDVDAGAEAKAVETDFSVGAVHDLYERGGDAPRT
jgi:hypothetical protein